MNTFDLSGQTLQRLQHRADQLGCSVETLVNMLLDHESQELKSRCAADAASVDTEPVLPVRNAATVNKQQLNGSGGRTNAMYRLLVEHNYDALSLHSPDGRFIYINPSYTDLLGYTVDELKQMAPHELAQLVHPDDLPRTRDESHAQAVRGDARTRVAYRMRRKDGSYVWVETTTVPIRDEAGQVIELLATTRNISTHKAAEQTLQEERQLFIGGPSVVFKWDSEPGWPVSYVSPNVLQQFGYQPEAFTSGAVHYGTIIHLEDLARVEAEVQMHARLKHLHFEQEYRIRHADGSYRWVLDSTVIIYEKDQPKYYQGYVQDITPRRQAEAAREQIEARLRATINAIPDLMFLHAADGTYIDCHAPDPALLIAPRAALIGKHVDEMLPDPIGTMYTRRITEVIRSGTPASFEYTLEIDGKPLHFEARMVRAGDDRALSIVRDVTEQRETQALLNLQNAALDAAANAIVITDRDAHIQWVNPAFTALTGYTLKQALGKNPNQLVKSGVHSQAFYDRMWRTILSGNVWFGKLVNRRQDGTLYTEEQTITPVYDDTGHISHFIAVKQDVTEREYSAHVLQEHERLKARFLREHEQTILIQQTISALSHDLRTPLSVIASSRELLSQYYDRMTDEKRREKLATIGRQLQYVIDMLDDLTQVVKGTQSEKPFKPASVNLAALCQISVDSVRETSDTGHQLTFTNPGMVDVVSVDEVLVSRILLNLLTNAIKYTPPEAEIRLELDHANGDVILRVIDHGPGINPEDLPSIFEPFYRSDAVKHISGSGLGLSIVRDCVDRHSGTIAVQSTPGKGTTFIVKLPVIASENDTPD
ncbi:MAG: PAS domain S-box protein [Phototrophicaceae bacterium]